MTQETKLRLVLENYHDRMSMVDSKATIDSQKIIERNDLNTNQLYHMFMEVSMQAVEQEDEAQNRAIAEIIKIMEGDK